LLHRTVHCGTVFWCGVECRCGCVLRRC
jgi:hypothetical protein